MKLPAWSYSSISTFKQCPHRYYRERVAKDIPKQPDSGAIIYGVELHKAAEDFVGADIPIPAKYSYIQPYMDKMVALPGTKFTELKVGIAREDGIFKSCDFFDTNVWFRGVIDLLSVDIEGATAYVVDYKTGKNAKYADDTQLGLMAAAVFLLHPQVIRVKGLLMYVVSKELIMVEYEYKNRFKVFEDLDGTLHRRTIAYESGVFNPSPNNLCKAWCPVVDCAHNGRS